MPPPPTPDPWPRLWPAGLPRHRACRAACRGEGKRELEWQERGSGVGESGSGVSSTREQERKKERAIKSREMEGEKWWYLQDRKKRVEEEAGE